MEEIGARRIERQNPRAYLQRRLHANGASGFSDLVGPTLEQEKRAHVK